MKLCITLTCLLSVAGLATGCLETDDSAEISTGEAIDQNVSTVIKVAHLVDSYGYVDPNWVDASLPNAELIKVPMFMEVGGLGRVSSFLKREKSAAANNGKGFLAVHAGNAGKGSLWSRYDNPQLAAELLNTLNLDALTLGSTDFSLADDALLGFVEGLDADVVIANLSITNHNPLEGYIDEFVVKEVKGTPVAIIGLIAEDEFNISGASEDFWVSDGVSRLQELIAGLSDIGVDLIIVMTQMGVEDAIDFAREVRGVDLIVDSSRDFSLSDDDNLGWNGVGSTDYYEVAEDRDPFCITNARQFADGVGLSEIQINKHGQVLGCDAQSVILTGDRFSRTLDGRLESGVDLGIIQEFVRRVPNLTRVEQDPAIEAMIEPYAIDFQTFEDSALGFTEAPLNKEQVGAHITRAMSFFLEPRTGDVYVGMVHEGLLQGGLNGLVTNEQPYSIVTQQRTLAAGKMSGAEIWFLIEDMLNETFYESSFYQLYFSNLRYTIEYTNLEGPPELLEASIRINDGTFELIDFDVTYPVATTLGYSDKGIFDGYFNAEHVKSTGFVISDVFSDYISSLPGSVLRVPQDYVTIFDNTGF